MPGLSLQSGGPSHRRWVAYLCGESSETFDDRPPTRPSSERIARAPAHPLAGLGVCLAAVPPHHRRLRGPAHRRHRPRGLPVRRRPHRPLRRVDPRQRRRRPRHRRQLRRHPPARPIRRRRRRRLRHRRSAPAPRHRRHQRPPVPLRPRQHRPRRAALSRRSPRQRRQHPHRQLGRHPDQADRTAAVAGHHSRRRSGHPRSVLPNQQPPQRPGSGALPPPTQRRPHRPEGLAAARHRTRHGRHRHLGRALRKRGNQLPRSPPARGPAHLGPRRR